MHETQFYFFRVLRLVTLIVAWYLLPGTLASAARITVINGSPYLSLNEVAGKLGMRFQWIKKAQKVRLSSAWTTLDFKKDDRICQVNGIKVFLNQPVLLYKKKMYLTVADYDNNIGPLLTPAFFTQPRPIKTIVIDPGHGDKDHGATNNYQKNQPEKVLTLDVAKRLQRLLQGQGIRTLLTRDSDKAVGLSQRAPWTNKHQAGLFISIHFNAAANTKAQGIETYALTVSGQSSTSGGRLSAADQVGFRGNKYNPWNVSLAYTVQKALIESTAAKDRGVKRARFKVLKDINCPGILVECGFLSNTSEAKKISSPQYREQLAQAILQGVLAYQKRVAAAKPASKPRRSRLLRTGASKR